MSNPKSVKLRVDLPHHWAIGGESMWADDLGDNKYQIKNIPFYAYGLNYDDIVLAEAESEEFKPEIKKLLEASGHRTLRIMFTGDKTKEENIKTIESIRTEHIGYEGLNDNQFAVNVTPEGNYNQLYDALEELEEKKFLSFETCEARVEGSFDDVPPE
ncbi:DUF4265 domain-containing protein [Undibacterium sp. Ji22W]|uniref:DUF4265 domain-containing protein n=1 Tax=Undibacterium sp. Ji22W TaxID=3413038 RepID=UPI003BF00918